MYTYYFIGVAGLLFILGGWVSSIKSVPPPRLSGLYSIGSLLLGVYSFLLRDPVFIILNIFAFLISAFQFFRGIKEKSII